MKNFLGQDLSIGDTVAYVTQGKIPRGRKGIITQWRFEHVRRYNYTTQQIEVVEVAVPLIYSWSRWSTGGFARWLKSCAFVFPINESVESIKAEMQREP